MAQIEAIEVGDELQHVLLLEPRPFRPFKSSEEYLWAMREDLAEWLDRLYSDIGITVENFMETLETGAVLCEHANNVRRFALNYKLRRPQRRFSTPGSNVPDLDIVYRKHVQPGSFFARDNIHNFIQFCKSLGIYECLLFETDDLVLRKNEKSLILCLLEVARRGAKYGMPAPLLVQFEREIDREIAQDEGQDLEDEFEDVEFGPVPQIITNDLRSLDEMVRDLVERCSCPTQFPMMRVSEGKYRIGDTKLLIYVRILRNHVMVRVGGGWDTLSHYLEKHDPCRCRSGHRATVGSKLIIKQNSTTPQMQVTYERATSPSSRRSSSASTASGPGSRKGSLAVEIKKYSVAQRSPSPNPLHRSHSPASPALLRGGRNGSFRGGCPLDRTPPQGVLPPPAYGGVTYGTSGYDSLESYDSGVSGNRSSPCDTSSEVSDEGYKEKERRRKETTDESDRPESSMTQASTDSSGISSNEPTSPITAVAPAIWITLERSDSGVGDDLKKRSRIPTVSSQRIKDELRNYGIGRSSSVNEHDGLERAFARARVGRGGSFRAPKSQEQTPVGRNRTQSGQTWSGRKRSDRARFSEETFSRSAQSSPLKVHAQRATSASPCPPRRSAKSVPTTPTHGSYRTPNLRDVFNDLGTEKDHLVILKRMAELVKAYQPELENFLQEEKKSPRKVSDENGRPPIPRTPGSRMRSSSISQEGAAPTRPRSSSISQGEDAYQARSRTHSTTAGATLPRVRSSSISQGERTQEGRARTHSTNNVRDSPRQRRNSSQEEVGYIKRRESGQHSTPSKIPVPVFIK